MRYSIFFLTPLIPSAEVWAIMGFICIIQECPEDRVFVLDHEESCITELQEDAIELPEEGLLHTGDLDEENSRI